MYIIIIKRNRYNYLKTMNEALSIFNLAIELFKDIFKYNKINKLGAMMRKLDVAALGGTFDGTNICVKEGLVMAFHPDGTPYGVMSKYGRWQIIHSHMINTPAWKFFKNCLIEKYKLTKISIGQGIWNFSNSSIPVDTYAVGMVGECLLDRLPSLVYDDPRQLSARAVIKEFRESYPANQDEDLVRPPSDWVWTRPEAKPTPVHSNVGKKTPLNPFEMLAHAEAMFTEDSCKRKVNRSRRLVALGGARCAVDAITAARASQREHLDDSPAVHNNG